MALSDKQLQRVDELVDMYRAKGKIPSDLIAQIASPETDDYDAIIRMFEDENITVLEMLDDDEVGVFDDGDLDEDGIDFASFEENDESFEEAIKDDKEFNDLNQEIENDLKNKDIDEIVSSIVSPTLM